MSTMQKAWKATRPALLAAPAVLALAAPSFAAASADITAASDNVTAITTMLTAAVTAAGIIGLGVIGARLAPQAYHLVSSFFGVRR